MWEGAGRCVCVQRQKAGARRHSRDGMSACLQGKRERKPTGMPGGEVRSKMSWRVVCVCGGVCVWGKIGRSPVSSPTCLTVIVSAMHVSCLSCLPLSLSPSSLSCSHPALSPSSPLHVLSLSQSHAHLPRTCFVRGRPPATLRFHHRYHYHSKMRR